MILIRPAFPAPFPSVSSPDGSYLALEGGAIEGVASPANSAQPVSDIGGNEPVMDDGSILASVSPVTGLALTSDGLVLYQVNQGDTVKSLAAKFNISVNTILWANGLSRGEPLSVGQELIILPVSGVLYDVQDGDTVNSISEAYNVSPADIVPLNSTTDSIQSGDLVIIENGKPLKGSSASLPNLDNYFVSPLKNGLDTGVVDANNGVNVSAFCGAPIYAAAEGLVTAVGDPSKSNNGLGGYVEISHPIDGVDTIYANTASNEVAVGDYVSQGEEIAKAGNTGNGGASAGCNLYFEVVGAQNPLAN